MKSWCDVRWRSTELESWCCRQYETRPGLAIFDFNAGSTNLHVPIDVIIDASMPNVIRDGGRIWQGEEILTRRRASWLYLHWLRGNVSWDWGIRKPQQDLRDYLRRHHSTVTDIVGNQNLCHNAMWRVATSGKCVGSRILMNIPI